MSDLKAIASTGSHDLDKTDEDNRLLQTSNILAQSPCTIVECPLCGMFNVLSMDNIISLGIETLKEAHNDSRGKIAAVKCGVCLRVVYYETVVTVELQQYKEGY